MTFFERDFMRAIYRLNINAPVGIVFNLVDDDEKVKLWMDGLEEIVYPWGRNYENPVGTRFRQKVREGGRIAEYCGEVIAYDKPTHLGLRIGNSKFLMQVDYRFTPNATGTRLDYEAEMIEARWFIRLMSRFFNGLTIRILERQMNRLKQLAETSRHSA